MDTPKRILVAATAALSLTFVGCRGDVDAGVESRRQQAEAAAEARGEETVTGKRLEFDQNGQLNEGTGTGGSGTADCEGPEASATSTCEGSDSVQQPPER